MEDIPIGSKWVPHVTNGRGVSPLPRIVVKYSRRPGFLRAYVIHKDGTVGPGSVVHRDYLLRSFKPADDGAP